MTGMLLGGLTAFALTCILAPYGIRILSRNHAGQPILGYVDNHLAKAGTPTMGGLFFIAGVLVAVFCLVRGQNGMALVFAASFFGYGAIGFLDDFLKVHFHHNQGLAAYQKIIAQLGLAALIAVYCYRSPYIGTELILPFVGTTVDIGWGIIPLVIVVMLAFTNSVNLTDGLDGLASVTTLSYLFVMLGVYAAMLFLSVRDGLGAAEAEEQRNLLICGGALAGGVLAFLLFNAHPAKVFMGDTGSLALGGGLAVLALSTKTVLLVPIVGIMFVWSSISVIVQVLWYKLTRRRVFLMAPFHHHLERKGWSETRVCVLYGTVTLLVGVAAVLLTLYLGGLDFYG